jgi:hypothetical protein
MKPHKHAEILRAIADGKEVQCKPKRFGETATDWQDADLYSENPVNEHEWEWRIKPEKKPNVVKYEFREAHPILDNAYNLPNLKLTFDGESGKLITSEVL